MRRTFLLRVESRRLSVAGAALLLVLGCGGGEREAAIPSAPHPIVLLDLGTVRADHLGCYGYERPTSPNIDRLASESVLFENAFGQAPMTGPSQASIFTGLYPSTHGMVEDGSRLPDEAVTLAEALGAHGYETAAFVDGGYLSEGFGLGQGFATYDNSQGGGLEVIGPKAIEWLRAHKDEDFLLLVHTYDAHTPYAPPEPDRSLFLDRIEPPESGFAPTAEVMEEVRASFAAGNPKPLSAREIEYAKALYDGEIHSMDRWLERFLDLFRELGLDEKATIVLFSDHGEEFQEHGSVLHEKLYATVTHVPLIVRFPGGAKAGRVGQEVELIDLMPTLLEISGAAIESYMQGESLVPLIRGEGQPPYLAFSESPFFGGQRAVALGGYHMITGAGGAFTELFHVVADPLEASDIAGAEGDRVEVMRRQIGAWEEKVAGFTLEGGEAALGDETLDQLKSLGYVQ